MVNTVQRFNNLQRNAHFQPLQSPLPGDGGVAVVWIVYDGQEPASASLPLPQMSGYPALCQRRSLTSLTSL